MGLRKTIAGILGAWKGAVFLLRKQLVGFENANAMLRSLDKRFAADILRHNGAEIGGDADIETPLFIHNAAGDYRNLRMGQQCHLGKNVLLDLRERIEIGDRVTVSMGVTITTHTDVGRSTLSRHYPQTCAGVHLGDDCYLGANVTILQGVSLGKSCLIAAGSVVTGSFPPFSVVAGVPAKLIRTLDA